MNEEAIEEARAQVSAASAELGRQSQACAEAIGAWVGRQGEFIAKRTVTTTKADRATELGAAAVASVRAAVSALKDSATTDISAQIKEIYWPHREIDEGEYTMGAYRTSSAGFNGTLPNQWVQVARRLIGDSVGRTLVDAGFDTAGPAYRQPDWSDDNAGHLSYPRRLDPDAELRQTLGAYDTALRAFISAESNRRVLVKERDEAAANDLWGDD